MVGFYGPVGEKQTSLQLPYPMRLSWQTSTVVHRITCHQKVSASLGRVLAAILAHFGSYEAVQAARLDLFGGCLNVRKVRGGDDWSIHSWGAAIDLDPDHNTLKMGRQQATMPQAVIDLFAAEGWTSLGASRNYDFMHFQAAKISPP